MSKILSIDYGSKRTGLAVTDSMKLIASGLNTVPTEKLMVFLSIYFGQETIEKIIIGLPKQLNGQEALIEISIQKFIDKLHKKYPNIPIERIDERFTSKLALNAMIEGGLKKKDDEIKHL